VRQDGVQLPAGRKSLLASAKAAVPSGSGCRTQVQSSVAREDSPARPSGHLAAVPGLVRDLAARPDGLEVTCAGPSMTPAVRPGDRVRVRAGAPIRPGDVFLFETSRGELELHRLVAALPGGWLVHRGDNQAIAGFDLVRADAVIGRADVPPRPPRRSEVARAVLAVTRRVPGAIWRRIGSR
jgi:hypothetical protein